MYGCERLDHKEGWALKKWYFWTMVLGRTLESPLDHKEIKPVNPKGNQFWIFIGRTDAEAETPILWPPGANSQPTGKDPDVGKDWRQEKGATEDDGRMVSPTQWTWTWPNSGRWWGTGKPGMMQHMPSILQHKMNTNPSQISENWNKGNITNLILWDEHDPVIKAWKRNHKTIISRYLWWI